MTLSRRSVLWGTTLLPLAILTPGCRRYGPICPGDTQWDAPAAPLTIDIHAHVFNATDLQVRDFVSRVGARQGRGGLATLAKHLGTLLQTISWNAAPNAAQERRGLERLGNLAKSCPAPELFAAIDSERSDQYAKAVKELKTAATNMRAARLLQRSGNWASASDEEKGLLAVEEMPDEYPVFRDRRALRSGPLEISSERVNLESALAFVTEMFQYRYGSVYRLLQAYNTPQRKLDLVVAHLVDYDWWLSGGRTTPTTLQAQIDLMQDIATVSGGRVHPFVPFCPFREAQHRSNSRSTFSSLALVQEAVRTKGAIGVKLYPPMGFAALGNAGVDPEVWKSASWLPQLAHAPGFGERLDAALRDLYSWCTREDVPVMAHTNASNGATEAFEHLAGPEYWQQALRACPTLRASFGHFGSVVSRSGSAPNAPGFLALMQAAGQPGMHAFADSAYFSEALDNSTALENALVALFQLDHANGRRLGSRLMFGTDWKMLVLESDADKYMSDMDSIMSRVASRLAPLGDYSQLPLDFGGRNAAMFLGLSKGGANRARLETFYSAHRMPPPAWMAKVDAA
jgi:predicted TIM-barrel fold metal-dependent hydrolase